MLWINRGPPGIRHGLWFITVTFTTVGYGEKTPITNMGKIVVMSWMFVGLGFYWRGDQSPHTHTHTSLSLSLSIHRFTCNPRPTTRTS